MFRHSHNPRLALCVIAALLATALGGCAAPASPARAPNSPGLPELASAPIAAEAAGQQPVMFVPNRGQLDERVAFYGRGQNLSLFFTENGVTLAMHGAQQRYALRQQFVGASAVVPVAEAQAATKVSYLNGPRAEWRAGLPTYTRLVYRQLWPGVDAWYDSGAEGMKYAFAVAPGADPDAIRLAYQGADTLEIAPDGSLRIDTPAGSLVDGRPLAFQEINGARVAVPVEYALHSDSNQTTYGFALGEYDRSQPLFVDPSVVVSSGFLGGAGSDAATVVALGPAGDMFVAGYTFSAEGFPATVGPDTGFNGGVDAFVARVSADGAQFRYVTYLGGTGFDTAAALAVDAAGNAYVAGQTQSDATSFPITLGPDTSFGGGVDGFVASVSADGTALRYAGYLGGSGFDGASGIAVTAAGEAVVVGQTASTTPSFPAAGAFDTSFGGGVDGFIAGVSANGAALRYAGYLGGAGDDAATAVTLDAAGNAYITGSTSSSSGFGSGGFDTSYNGAVDAFLASVSANGATLRWASYFGGGAYDAGSAVALGPDRVYLAGQTESPAASFPDAVGPDRSFNGDVDGFVAALSLDGATLRYAGYLGSVGADGATAIAAGPAGVAYVAGTTDAGADFPLLGGPRLEPAGGSDAWLAKVGADGSRLLMGGFLGGTGDDQALGMVVDGTGNARVVGLAPSGTDFPTAAGPDLSSNGETDGYLATLGTIPDIALEPQLAEFVTAGEPFTATLRVTDAELDRGIAGSVVVSGTVEGALELLTVTADRGSCTGTTAFRCDLDDLGNGEVATITLAMRAASTGTVRIAASAVFAEPDPLPANNQADVRARVVLRTYLPLSVK